MNYGNVYGLWNGLLVNDIMPNDMHVRKYGKPIKMTCLKMGDEQGRMSYA